MKKTLLIITILLFSFYFLNAQEVIEKKYCKNEYGVPAKSEKKAKYIKLTIKESDGTMRYEIRNLKSDKLVNLKCYKNEMPVGKWIAANGRELDYDFDLISSEKEYENVIKYDIHEKKVIGEIKGKFEAPLFPQFEDNFRKHIAMNLRYPVPAQENGLQGKVISQFIIDETGKITNLSILKSAHKVLDKEAARVILSSPNWTPAMIDGEPVKVMVIVPTVFVLQ
jgi:TonB family protein